jgi:hypothetical protein
MTDNALTPYQAPATPAPYDDAPTVPAISRDFIRPRLPELGRIRLGEKRITKRDGKEISFPSKLDRFRFTSRDKALIVRCAEAYGGTVEPWASDEGPQWQVISDATSIPVVVPRAELAFSQWFENWDGAVCRRRCDGYRDIVRDCPCTCVDRDRECLPTTRLSVILPGIKGMGVWRMESHGYNAAAEILGTIELAAAYGASLIPATLVLAQRSKRRPDPKDPKKIITNRFVVPVLSIEDSLDDMLVRAKQIHARQLGILPSANERATDNTMRGLRAAVFTRWPHSTEEPERTMRLGQLSDMLGRRVETISNQHDLSEGEALRLANMVDSLPQELQPASAREPAAPALSGSSPSGAEPTAPPSSAGGLQPRTDASVATGDLAEHHTQGSAGDEAPLLGSAPGSHEKSAAPAEHHTQGSAGVISAPGQGAISEGTSVGVRTTPAPAEHVSEREGGLGEVTPLPPEPKSPAPTRKRKASPAPSVAQVREHQKAGEQTRKQETVDRTPTDPLHWLPPADVKALVDFCYGRDAAEKQETARRLVRNMSLQMGLHDEWPDDKLEILRQRTFGAKR